MSAIADATQPRSIAPRNPNDPATEGQRNLMKRLRIRARKDMTQGQASDAIARYLDRNPEVAAQLETERRERQQARWVELRTRYERASIGRCRPLGKPVASEGQIGGLMSRAFRRPRGDVLRADVLGALELGVSSAQASALIREMDETPLPGARPQAQAEQEPQRMAA
jgi:hypothetical protein